MASGCAILKLGPSDEEMLKDLHFVGAEDKSYEDRARESEEFLPMLEDWGMEISTDETEIVIDGDTAKIGPIGFELTQGSVQIILLTTKEEDGCWRITGEMEQ
jgi:hypothetical protein